MTQVITHINSRPFTLANDKYRDTVIVTIHADWRRMPLWETAMIGVTHVCDKQHQLVSDPFVTKGADLHHTHFVTDNTDKNDNWVHALLWQRVQFDLTYFMTNSRDWCHTPFWQAMLIGVMRFYDKEWSLASHILWQAVGIGVTQLSDKQWWLTSHTLTKNSANWHHTFLLWQPILPDHTHFCDEHWWLSSCIFATNIVDWRTMLTKSHTPLLQRMWVNNHTPFVTNSVDWSLHTCDTQLFLNQH